MGSQIVCAVRRVSMVHPMLCWKSVASSCVDRDIKIIFVPCRREQMQVDSVPRRDVRLPVEVDGPWGDLGQKSRDSSTLLVC
mmetsp:Transcript_20509/g.54979  ORF Transcript_20509/g.54979 Transcript_20509/m.54979 type:complete len:82 (-) Transcript_20509:135-380(-)